MSEALYGVGGLRFWTEREILVREQAIQTLALTVRDTLTAQNSAWAFHRVEGPLLTPRKHVSPAYDESDIFLLEAKLNGETGVLRAETTASSYLYAAMLLHRGDARAPLVVWQAGKSFRRETNDGARASELRFNEFYQIEFQCIYKDGTKADIRGALQPAIAEAIRKITRSKDARLIPSERLPDYSMETMDVEVPYGVTTSYEDYGQGQMNVPVHTPKWKEMASISTRTDFPIPGHTVLEVAIGLDRLVVVESEAK